MPQVSILVPVYNVEPYLKASIDSILAQTFTDFELILINDGSTDRSGEIIDSYRDPRIVVVHKENEGVARTLNRGLAVARGTHIRRFDADDTCTPEAIADQIRFIERHPDIALVATQQAFQTSHGKIAWHHRMPHNDYFAGQEYRLVAPNDFGNYSPIVHGTVLLRKSVLDEVGTYRTEFMTSEDEDLWLRTLEKYPVAILNKCTYFLRLHATSATKSRAATCQFYYDLALKFHEERITYGSDPLLRGETMPTPPIVEEFEAHPCIETSGGRMIRHDLDYQYRLTVDARDWRLVRSLAREALLSGWRRLDTYKLLLFPLMGESLVKAGVKIKALFK